MDAVKTLSGLVCIAIVFLFLVSGFFQFYHPIFFGVSFAVCLLVRFISSFWISKRFPWADLKFLLLPLVVAAVLLIGFYFFVFIYGPSMG